VFFSSSFEYNSATIAEVVIGSVEVVDLLTVLVEVEIAAVEIHNTN